MCSSSPYRGEDGWGELIIYPPPPCTMRYMAPLTPPRQGGELY